LKKSFGLRAAQIRQLGVAESVTYRRDMPSIRQRCRDEKHRTQPANQFFSGL